MATTIRFDASSRKGCVSRTTSESTRIRRTTRSVTLPIMLSLTAPIPSAPMITRS